jgi:hypothetical protein
MTERRIAAFFYGLFMDQEILRESQIEAMNPLRAYVEGYALRIGRRATLVPSPGARTYGIVFELTHDELEKLYSTPGLEQYRPEAILVRSMDGDSLPALCYNLQEAPRPGEANSEYAARLQAVLGKLGFPPEYIESIA